MGGESMRLLACFVFGLPWSVRDCQHAVFSAMLCYGLSYALSAELVYTENCPSQMASVRDCRSPLWWSLSRGC